MNIKISKNGIVYCDADFLVAYGAKKTHQPEVQNRAKILFAELLVNQCKICASILTFDETWRGIRVEFGPKKISSRFRFLFNKLLNKIGIKLENIGATEFSYCETEILDNLKLFTDNLIKKKLEVIQFYNCIFGISDALNNLEVFNLRPRDAFHLAFMKNRKVNYFISNDNHFKRVKDKIKSQAGIEIINF